MEGVEGNKESEKTMEMSIRKGIRNHRPTNPIRAKPSNKWRLGEKVQSTEITPEWWPDDSKDQKRKSDSNELVGNQIKKKDKNENGQKELVAEKDVIMKMPCQLSQAEKRPISRIEQAVQVEPKLAEIPVALKEFMPKLKPVQEKNKPEVKPRYLSRVQSKLKEKLDRDRADYAIRSAEKKAAIKGAVFFSKLA